MRIASVSYPGAPRIVVDEAEQRLTALLSTHKVIFTRENVTGVFFITGGSEKEAVDVIGADHHVVLMAFAEQNAFASAIEVKSWLDDQGIPCDLFNLSSPAQVEALLLHTDLLIKLSEISHKRFGLLGSSSPWLINSTPDPEVLRNKFGHRLVKIPWNDAGEVSTYPISPEYLNAFQGYGHPDHENHSRIHTLLTQMIQEHQLNGIAVECFPLVNQSGITACPALALLNAQGFPAACEGDLVSLTGMSLVQSLTGVIPWMANLSGVFESHAEFSHCTAPLNLISEFQLNTHYETRRGLAIQAKFHSNVFTILRLDRWFRNAFVATGKLRISEPAEHCCRTRVVLDIKPEQLNKLLVHPLGNHHLLIPWDFESLLLKALRILNISVL